MTEKTKPVPEKAETASKKETAAQPVETTPIEQGEVSAMLVPESPNDPKTQG